MRTATDRIGPDAARRERYAWAVVERWAERVGIRPEDAWATLRPETMNLLGLARAA
jgi:hypothetical protein